MAGGLAKDHVRSQGYQFSDIVHDSKWYQEHALELNHDRQDELFRLYKEDLQAFEALSGCIEAHHYNGLHSMTGGRSGGYFESAATQIAKQEGWLYDQDFRLNDWRKQAATAESMGEMFKYKCFVKLQREKYETTPDALRNPYIGDNGNWWFGGRGGKDTGIPASLESFPWVCEDKVWMFGKTKTQHEAPDATPIPMIYRLTSGAPEFEYDAGQWRIDCASNIVRTISGDEVELPEDINNASLMEDGYFWLQGNKTRLRVSPGRWQNYKCKPDGQTITIAALLEWEGEQSGYGNDHPVEAKAIGWYALDTGIPSIRFRKLQLNDKIIPELYALADAAWIGWSSDVEELKAYCELCGCIKEFFDFINCRNNRPYKDAFYPDSYSRYYWGGREAAKALTKSMARGMGYASYKYDEIAKIREEQRRIKSHQNPAKLDEWSNLVFDLVNGEEHIEPEKYRELLEKFKSITGEDFTRGVDYLNMFRRLAIEDGWYIPEENDDWFLNPAPPEPVETYGCSELPTRYQ